MAPSYTLARQLLTLPAELRNSALRRALALQPLRSLPSAAERPFSTHPANLRSEPTPSSVNHDEVSHFTALASSWWDPHGSSRLLHLMNPLRHQFLRRCMDSDSHAAARQEQQQQQQQQRTLRFLDIGCGGGIFAESAARLASARSVTAIDPTPEVIAVAQRHQRSDPLLLEPGRLTYHNIAIEELALPQAPEQGYDVISLFEVIEHIRVPAEFLDRVLQHLRPGGWLIGSTIARTGVSWFTTKFVAEEVLGMVPRGTHEWKQYISPHELREWARSRQELEMEVGGKGWKVMGVVYVPGLGWKEVNGSEDWGNYFFGVRKREA